MTPAAFSEQGETQMLRGIEVIDRQTNEVVHFVNCEGKGDRAMDRIHNGLVNRTDLDRFFVREVGR